MKKSALIALLCAISALLLSGCGKDRAADCYYDFSARLRAAENIVLTADIGAEYEDRRTEHRLYCERSGGESLIRVIEPECIEGIEIHLTGREAKLEYNSILIDAPLLDDSGLSPVTALPVLLDTLCRGFPEACGEDSNEYIWKLILDDNISAEVHYSKEEQRPVSAEIISGGSVKLRCKITQWDG